MGVEVRLPALLRSLTQGASTVNVSAQTIAQLIDELEQRYPGVREKLCDENGNLRRYINVYVNSEDIRDLGGPDTPLKDGDEVAIVPAIAGGA